MHFALSQPDVQRAKMRLYAVIEATKGLARLHNRRIWLAVQKGLRRRAHGRPGLSGVVRRLGKPRDRYAVIFVGTFLLA